MNQKQSADVAAKALPCPFCGESLTSKSDHHGHWVAHEQEPGPCFDSTIQLMSAKDLVNWNKRRDEGLFALCKLLDMEMDGVACPASAAAILNAIRRIVSKGE